MAFVALFLGVKAVSSCQKMRMLSDCPSGLLRNSNFKFGFGVYCRATAML